MSWYDYMLNRSYASAYAATTLPSVSSSIGDDADDMPWDDDNWVPRNKSGRQMSPNQIRGELQRYIDANSLTKSKLMKEIGVTAPAFYKFMNVGFCKLRDFAVEHSFLLVDYFNAFSNYLFIFCLVTLLIPSLLRTRTNGGPRRIRRIGPPPVSLPRSSTRRNRRRKRPRARSERARTAGEAKVGGKVAKSPARGCPKN